MKRIVLFILTFMFLSVSCTNNTQNTSINTKKPASEDSALIENEGEDIANEEDNNDNFDWLAGKWMDGSERRFVKEAEIKKIKENYYINVACMFNRRFPLAQTEDLLLIFDEGWASAYYEDDGGGNKGNIYLYIDENNRSFSMKVEEIYSNGPTVNRISTLGSTLEMTSYEEPELPTYNYTAGSNKFYDLVDYMQSNIWFANDSSSIEWAFVPNRMSLGDGYLYENGEYIGRYLIYDKSDVNNNELLFNLELNSTAENKDGKIIITDELMEIYFDDSEEALIFSSVLEN